MSVVFVYMGYSFLNMSNNSTPLFVETEEDGNDDLIDTYSEGTAFVLSAFKRFSLPKDFVDLCKEDCTDPKAYVSPPLLQGDLANRFGKETSRLWFDSLDGGEEDEKIPPLYDLPLEVVNRVLYD